MRRLDENASIGVGIVVTVALLFTGVGGLFGGGVTAYLHRARVYRGAALGAIVGALGGVATGIILVYLDSSLSLSADVFSVALLNATFGAFGGGLGSLAWRYVERRGTDS